MDDMYLFWRRKTSISGNVKEVFSALWELAGCKPGILTEVTLARLTNFTGFSANALDNRIKLLEKAGLIERETIGRGVFRIYVYHPSPEKREETRPQKIEKPTPLFDALDDESFILAGTRENHDETHDETHDEIHDEIHEHFHDENHGKPISNPQRGLRVKTPSRRSVPPGGKYTLNNIKVKKEVFSSKTEGGKPPHQKSGKPVEAIFKEIDRESDLFKATRTRVETTFREKDISPDLIDRIAAGVVMRLPGFERASLDAIKEESWERKRAETIVHRYIHVARYAQDAFEANGYVWSPVRSARKARLENRIAGVR